MDFGLVNVTRNFTGMLYAAGGLGGIYKNNDDNFFGGGAGIGSGGFNMADSQYYWGKVFGSIEIHGGTIEAISLGDGAGIGGGGAQGIDTALSEISIHITGGK